MIVNLKTVTAVDSYMQVDNMHARLYKDMIISSEQRTRMAAYWIQWKRSRRSLDTLLDTACDHLECLPMDLDLPSAFLTHLSTLCCSPQASSHTCAMHDAHELSSVGAGVRVSIKELDVSSCTPQFLGQSGEAMAQGHGAVQVLRDMHMQDRDLYMDNLAAQMPGVFVSSVQVRTKPTLPIVSLMYSVLYALSKWQQHRHNLCFHSSAGSNAVYLASFNVQAMRMWSEYMMFRVAPGDFLALCQLAATQQHRQKLFQGCR